MQKIKDIVFALQRSSTHGSVCKGESCPYHCYEDLTGTEYEALADIEKDGRKLVSNCDIDRIALDAADALEELNGKERH